MTQLVLSLFPGVGLLDMAFEAEGFCVVRWPDLLWGGDVRRFHPPAERFDGVIGGPPCQAFSRMRHIVEHGRRTGRVTAPPAENLIPEFERCVAESAPVWFVMENVPDAPLPAVAGYRVHSQLVDNRWFGEVQQRKRRWSFGTPGGLSLALDGFVALENPEREPAVCASGSGRSQPVAVGGSGKRKRRPRAGDLKSTAAFRRACALQGLPETWDLPPFRVDAKIRAVGNGVPIPMGRAIARAVKRALEATP